MKKDLVEYGSETKTRSDVSYYCSDAFKLAFGSNFDEWENKVGKIEKSLSREILIGNIHFGWLDD